jgi:hypothetical protein
MRYEWAIDELTGQWGTTRLEDYGRLTQYAAEARAERDEARRALDRFKSEHPKK